jgi:Ca-activated chloride channel family protein
MSAAVLPLLLLAAPEAAPLEVRVDLARPVEVAGRAPTRNVLRIGLRGQPRGDDAPARPPLNLALVLDRSGSMAEEKLARAQQAARMVIERLGPDDILALVAYDDEVDVLAPASRVRDASALVAALERLEASGDTALFAGVSRGLAEARRFVDPGRVDRVLLLSDGQANVGPDAPSELGRLGAAAAREGITVTTIGLGLGYNEDLMTRLARESDGNHGFAESARDLARFFEEELRDAMAVVAEAVELRLELAPGVKIARAINRPLEQYGRHAVGRVEQIGAEQEKHFLVELELPPGAAGSKRRIGQVHVSARGLSDGRPRQVSAPVHLRYVEDARVATQSENEEVMVATVEAIAVRNNRAAVALRDQGRVKEAQETLEQNAVYLEEKAQQYGSEKLERYSEENAESVDALGDDRAWRRARKKMRSRQHALETQQSY